MTEMQYYNFQISASKNNRYLTFILFEWPMIILVGVPCTQHPVYPPIPYPDVKGLAVSAAAAATAVADAALVAAAVAADTAFFIPVTYIFNVIILKSFYVYIIVLTFSFFS